MVQVADELDVNLFVEKPEADQTGLPMVKSPHGVEEVSYTPRPRAETCLCLLKGGVRMAHVHQDPHSGGPLDQA